jgi:hypothetical protein
VLQGESGNFKSDEALKAIASAKGGKEVVTRIGKRRNRLQCSDLRMRARKIVRAHSQGAPAYQRICRHEFSGLKEGEQGERFES